MSHHNLEWTLLESDRHCTVLLRSTAYFIKQPIGMQITVLYRNLRGGRVLMAEKQGINILKKCCIQKHQQNEQKKKEGYYRLFFTTKAAVANSITAITAEITTGVTQSIVAAASLCDCVGVSSTMP